MAEKEIITLSIESPGQNRRSRRADELSVHFADIDERTARDFLLHAKRLAEVVDFYDADPATPSADWSRFFDYNESDAENLPDSDSGDMPPHLGLFLSFLKLYEVPQEMLNRFTGRHLDFYYRDVLRFGKKPPQWDKAHLLIELKKNMPATEIGPNQRFSAGKDAKEVERLYVPSRRTVINAAKVASLRGVRIGKDGIVRRAPIVNSSNGEGGELKGPEPKWPPFGSDLWPEAELGFALAAPVLRMKEGSRRITIILTLSGAEGIDGNAKLRDFFEARLSGEKGWFQEKIDSIECTKNKLTFVIQIPATEQAVVDCNEKLHQFSCSPPAPIIQVLLKQPNGQGYGIFKGITVDDAKITVVAGRSASQEEEPVRLRTLHVETDFGVVDPKKPFLPFGPQPTRGSRFSVVSPEAAGKSVTKLDLLVNWKGIPDEDLAQHYHLYDEEELQNNNYFTADITARDRSRNTFKMPQPAPLFVDKKASAPQTFTVDKGGDVTLSLNRGFLQTKYTELYVKAAIALAKFKSPPEEADPKVRMALREAKDAPAEPEFPKEPYIPTIAEISLSYEATSDTVEISSIKENDYKNEEILYFHIGSFATVREHGYLRKKAGFLEELQTRVPLLPEYRHEGELYLGFSDLRGGDSVSVLFQAAEGSNDPELNRYPLKWSVLCNNYWKPLSSTEVLLDSTKNFLRSGIITFVIPSVATVANTILPAGFLWIRATVDENTGAVCHLIEVAANAIEVTFRDNGNDLSHLSAPLPPATITKLKTPMAAVKAVIQPYATFGGAPEEADADFHVRVAERLRHKDRCITGWDYERMVLEAFPNIHLAKCIPHAKKGSWRAPGNVLVVVVPDLRNRNAADPLEPKVDTETLDRIAMYLRARTSLHVNVDVKNPAYQKLELDFKVKFKEGLEFNYYSKDLNVKLKEYLSPWAFETASPKGKKDGGREITFGGRIYKSVILDFIDEIGYVDYVTDFRMYTYTNSNSMKEVDEAQPESPDAILVSAPLHIINEVPE